MAFPYYNPYQYQFNNNYGGMNAPQPQVQQVQPQYNGLISVRSEQEAQNYPVAPGNSVIFRDENANYLYTKTMGYSQLDKPTFERYRLVKENVDIVDNSVDKVDKPDYALKSDLAVLSARLKILEDQLKGEHKNEQFDATHADVRSI